VWFTVSASLYDKANEPTMVGVGVQLAVVTASFFSGPLGPLVSAGVVIGVGTLSGLASVRGTSMSGVYADGKLLTVRGMADLSSKSYLLHFADAVELAAAPYAGPPNEEQIRLMNEAIDAAGSSSGSSSSSASSSSTSEDIPSKDDIPVPLATSTSSEDPTFRL